MWLGGIGRCGFGFGLQEFYNDLIPVAVGEITLLHGLQQLVCFLAVAVLVGQNTVAGCLCLLTAYFLEEYNISRKVATRITSALSMALCMLSLVWVFDIEWLDLKNTSFFDIFDYATANILMPLGGLFTCIFATWKMKPQFMRDEITNYGELRGRAYPLLYYTLRYVTPLLIIYIFLKNLGVL